MIVVEFLQVLWLLLPAGFANMAPVLFGYVPFLDCPISKKLFGKNKTYRGFVFGIAVAIIVAQLQRLIVPYLFTSYEYSYANPWILGVLLGFGALFGDLVKSFFKRRAGIRESESWAPFDQIDWIVGALIFLNFYILLSWRMNLFALLLFGLAHPVINYLGYLMRIKENKF